MNCVIIGWGNGFSPYRRSHHLNYWWLIVNGTFENKLQWALDKNANGFIQENTVESIACIMWAILFGSNVVRPNIGFGLCHKMRVGSVLMVIVSARAAVIGLTSGTWQDFISFHAACPQNVTMTWASWRLKSLGLYSLSGKTSYRQISWSLEAARLDVAMVVSLWNVTGTSAAALPRYLPNFRAIGKV